MRISDWSSDVCSSDLSAGTRLWGNSCRDWYQDAHGDRASQRNDGWQKSCRRSFDAEKPRLGCVTEEKRTARTRVYRGRKSRSEEHTSELQSLMRISYAVFCLKTKKKNLQTKHK